MDAIRTDNLTKAFGDLIAVDHLTMSVAPGEIFGLVGPDGAGKTTVMRLLSGIMDPTGGEAFVAGCHTVKQAERIKERIGYMSQQFGLYGDLTVMENILFYADIYDVPRKDMPVRIDRLLEFSNLQPFRKRLAGNLSGGMKQKLGLVCALVHTPQVLFLDEPTNGVDPVSRRDFWRILYQLLAEGVTIFVSTAYLDEAERCHRLALMHRGRLLAMGTPQEVKGLMRGAIIEVRGENPRLLAESLKAAFPPGSVGLFGDCAHVVSDQADQAAQQVRAVLSAAGMSATSVRSIEPTLEDVFISVVTRPKDYSPLASPVTSVRGHTDQQQLQIANCQFQIERQRQQQYDDPPRTPKPNDNNGLEGGTNSAVVVRDLTKRFGDFVAVDRVNFEVARGEVFGFLGPNGAGKSTTIRMLCGILAPTSGAGSVAGLDIFTQAEQIKERIGYMSQRFSLYQDLTVEENIDFYSGIYRIAADRKQARKDWAIEMAGLGGHRHSRTAALSGGWKQRLALGCAILHSPPIIFLDEPTSGVDPISRRQFWDLIYELAAGGVTVFVTTHYMDEAEYCDRLGLIYRGELIAIGTGAQLKTQHMPHDVLEIACDRPADMIGLIEKLPGVKEAALFGRTLHAVCPEGDSAAGAIRTLLASHGQDLATVAKIVPSLEDVFVSLIEAHDRAEGPRQEVRA